MSIAFTLHSATMIHPFKCIFPYLFSFLSIQPLQCPILYVSMYVYAHLWRPIMKIYSLFASKGKKKKEKVAIKAERNI
jgi:hypothetical protein